MAKYHRQSIVLRSTTLKKDSIEKRRGSATTIETNGMLVRLHPSLKLTAVMPIV